MVDWQEVAMVDVTALEAACRCGQDDARSV